jgi:hypothetical protein
VDALNLQRIRRIGGLRRANGSEHTPFGFTFQVKGLLTFCLQSYQDEPIDIENRLVNWQPA